MSGSQRGPGCAQQLLVQSKHLPSAYRMSDNSPDTGACHAHHVLALASARGTHRR